MKILHVTFHNGCAINLDFVAKKLGHELETQFALLWNYNIGHDRAADLWNKHKDYYDQFDLIITSDTAPLSRIFLQNNYAGKLIIWVCNRFDYHDAASNDCGFPDSEYYQLFRAAVKSSNVKIFSYTQFEHEFAMKYRNTILPPNVIKPCAFMESPPTTSLFPADLNKNDTFLVPAYHNDTHFLDLTAKCNSLGIQVYGGRYNGPSDLVGIKGIIHIPYAWSNLALFENWSLGNVYFIPSKTFLFELIKRHVNFFWSPPFVPSMIESSEWYAPEHKNLFAYFDSWDDLKQKTNDSSYIAGLKTNVLKFQATHTATMLDQWNKAINDWPGII